MSTSPKTEATEAQPELSSEIKDWFSEYAARALLTRRTGHEINFVMRAAYARYGIDGVQKIHAFLTQRNPEIAGVCNIFLRQWEARSRTDANSVSV